MIEKVNQRDVNKLSGLSDEAADGIDLDDVVREAGYRDADAIMRQVLRGEETKGDPDERDIAGAIDFEDTPRGREETKNNTKIKGASK